MKATVPKSRLVELPAMAIAGFRDHFSSSDPHGISAQWQRLAPYLGSIPGQVGRAAYGVCFQKDSGFDYLSGVEVGSVESLTEGFQYTRISAQRYAVFPHQGHVSQLYETISKIWHEWLPSYGLRPAESSHGGASFFERYGEKFDPRSGTGDMEVWIPVE